MSMSRVVAIVAAIAVAVFALSFLHGAAKHKRQTYWLSRMWGQFHVIQGLGTSRPVLSEPIGGGAPGRYAAMAAEDDLVVIHETEVPRRSENEPRASIRYYLLLRKNGFGGWDLRTTTNTVAELDKHPDAEGVAEKLAASATTDVLVHDYLLPVRDAYALEAARATVRRSSGWDLLLADELKKTPDDLMLRLAELDAAVVGEDAELVRRKLAEMEKLPNAGERPLVASAAKKYAEWLEAKSSGARADVGAAFALLEGSGSGNKPLPPLDALRDAFAQLPADAEFRSPNSYLAIKSRPQAVNPATARAVAAGLHAKSRDEADPAKAMEWLLPMHRAAAILARDSAEQLDAVASFAIRDEAASGVEDVLGRPDVGAAPLAAIRGSIDEMWRLDASIGTPRAFAGVPAAEASEAIAAHRVPTARLGLAHIATAVRAADEAPKDNAALAKLLGGDIGNDPFGNGASFLATFTGEGITVRSLGPDGDDDSGAIAYDPTNGIVTDGDIMMTTK